MEVRRNTRTSPTVGRQQFAQAEQTDYRPLLQGATDLRAGLDQARRRRQSFELQKRLLEESNALAQELEERRRDPNTDPAQLALDADQFYTGRLTAVVEEYRQQGFDVDLVDDFALGASRLRNELSGTALNYQMQALNTKAISDLSTAVGEGEKRVISNIDEYEQTLALLEDTIDLNPDLTPDQRIKAKDDLRSALPQIAAQSKAMEDPNWIISQLDPEGRYRPEAAATTAAASSGTAVGSRQDAIRKAADELGVTPVELAGIANYESAGTLDPNIVGGAGGNYAGIFQFGPEERRKYWGGDTPPSFEKQVEALVRFAKDRGYEPGMGWEKLYTTINAGNPFASVQAADANGTQADHYRNIAQTHFPKAEEFLGVNSDLVGGGERVPQPGDVLSLDPDQTQSTTPAFDQAFNDLSSPNADAEQVTQLHPVLRDLDAASRLRLLETSYRVTEQKRENGKAEMQLRIDNLRAGGSGPVPTLEELTPLFGEVAAGQIIAEIGAIQTRNQFTKDWETASIESIRADLKKLEPALDDPARATKLPIFQEAEKAAAALIEKRLGDPAAYVLQTNPAVRAAIEAGDTRKFYALQRSEQTRLGIPKSQQNPWPEEYIAQQKETYKRLSVTERYGWIMRHMVGATKEEFGNFIAQFDGSDAYSDLNVAQMLYHTRSQQSIDRMLPLILQGSAAIREDPAKRPPAETMLKQFQTELLAGVGNANPTMSKAIQDAAVAIYVARGGRPDGTDVNLYRESLREAVGGKPGQRDTGWADFRKNDVTDLTILPPNVTRSQFETWMRRVTTQELAAMSRNGRPQYGTGESVKARDILEEGVFVLIAPGVYTVKFRGGPTTTQYAVGDNGRPIELAIPGSAIANAVNAEARERRASGPLDRLRTDPRALGGF